jgi:prepilin-type N-terminal cleavage/methylation domain-containing protein
MRAYLRRSARSQAGFTLVELLVASVIGVIVMTGLTSVVLTTWRAGSVATSRVEASGQIRSFQFDAYDDFALSGAPTLTNCAPSSPPPCSITLSGLQASNSVPPVTAPYTVTYTWDGTNVDRQVGSGAPKHAATNVTAFSAVLSGTAPHQTVVVTLTVTVQAYVETQTLQFYPHVYP